MDAGCDWSFHPPGIDALRRAGMRFACRYVGLGSAGKHLTRSEVLALSAAGIRVVLLAEADERGALGGRSRGATHAAIASKAAHAVGAPPSAPIYFAVDFDAVDRQLGMIDAYLQGAASVIGRNRVGVYAEYDVVHHAFDRGLVGYACQTYAWSHGRWDNRAQLRQTHNAVRLGAGIVDLCTATVADYGGWIDTPDPGIERETTMDDELRRAIHHIGWRQFKALLGEDPIAVPAAPELGIEAYQIPNLAQRQLLAAANSERGPVVSETDRRLVAAAVGMLHPDAIPAHLLPDHLLPTLTVAPAPAPAP